MFTPRIKRGIFWLEALNSLGTTWYFYFIFFFLKDTFAFNDRKNLVWGAVLGAVFTVAAIIGGRVGQRLGYFRALGFGFATMAAAFFYGAFAKAELAHLAVLVVGAFGMCFTWANLEAFIAEGETPQRLQRNLGGPSPRIFSPVTTP
jgi:predicted MFS family arabinose efflux permease